MPVSALLVEYNRAKSDSLIEGINTLPGAEVHQVQDSHMVVVTDTNDVDEDRELGERLRSLPGILTAHVVYSNMEDVLSEGVSQ